MFFCTAILWLIWLCTVSSRWCYDRNTSWILIQMYIIRHWNLQLALFIFISLFSFLSFQKCVYVCCVLMYFGKTWFSGITFEGLFSTYFSEESLNNLEKGIFKNLTKRLWQLFLLLWINFVYAMHLQIWCIAEKNVLNHHMSRGKKYFLFVSGKMHNTEIKYSQTCTQRPQLDPMFEAVVDSWSLLIGRCHG